MLTRREASTPRPSPRCTCLPPRQHCAEVALGASTTDSAAMLTQREASTPRPSPRCTCLPPRQHCVEVALGGKQVHLGFASEYLLSSSCNFNSSPPRPRPSSPRLRLGELGLGLGGLERSQWVGTSCNFSSSPHPPTVGLILKFCSPLRISIAPIICHRLLLAGLSSRNVLVQASEKAWTWRDT